MLARRCEACGHSLRGDRDELTVGPFYMNMDLRAVKLVGVLLSLTAAEFDVLELLLCRAGRIVPYQAFFTLDIFGEDRDQNNLAVVIYRLRRKFAAVLPYDPIRTVREFGYIIGG